MPITVKQLRAAFAKSGRDWDQLCQAAAYNASVWTGGAHQPYPSAIDAYRHSSIVSKDPTDAPLGAVHYWDIGRYGHVAVGLGGERVVMASKHIDVRWGNDVGETTVGRYNKRTGAHYLGWARTNGVNRIMLLQPAVKATPDRAMVKRIGHYLNGRHLGAVTTAPQDGVRGPIYWRLVQTAGRKDGLYGAAYTIDGVPGAKTRALEQHYNKVAA